MELYQLDVIPLCYSEHEMITKLKWLGPQGDLERVVGFNQMCLSRILFQLFVPCFTSSVSDYSVFVTWAVEYKSGIFPSICIRWRGFVNTDKKRSVLSLSIFTLFWSIWPMGIISQAHDTFSPESTAYCFWYFPSCCLSFAILRIVSNDISIIGCMF